MNQISAVSLDIRPATGPAQEPEVVPRPALVLAAQACASALLLGLMLHQRYGYSAGDRDHLVLSPLGEQRADPGAFANDWTLANVPQPHWLFDLITALASRYDVLAAVYFGYFALSLLGFGLGTAMLARAWAPGYTWIATLSVTAIGATTPLYLLGSGAIFWPTALPNGLGGFLLYLTVAALLVGRHRLAAFGAVAVAVVHVQQGLIAGVLLALMAVAVAVKRRRFDPALAIGTVAALGVVAGALRARPIAGNFQDFATICDELIPYHCNATAWTGAQIIAGLALISLALLCVVYLRAGERYRWFVVLVVPAAALLSGLAADLYNVPALGVLAQGTNIYRLSLIFVPFIAWGIVASLFADLSPARRWLLLAGAGCLWYTTFRGVGGWGLSSSVLAQGHWLLGSAIGLVAACLALTLPDVVSRPRLLYQAAVAGVVLACLASAFPGIRSASLRPFGLGLMPHSAALVAWGRDVQAAVPIGSQLVLPPTFQEGRTVTRRAVIADCKYAPYGGSALRGWSARLDGLGGVRQCLGEKPGYSEMSATELEAAARKFGAGYAGLLPEQEAQADQLRRRGWTPIVPSAGRSGVDLWKAPWA